MPPPPRPRTGNKRPGGKPGGRPAAATAPRVLGSLDRVDPDGTLQGWCWAPDHPQAHRTVAVTIDGHVVARAACNRAHPELADIVGSGDHGFLLRLAPGLLRTGAEAEVALRDVASGQLVGAPQRVTWGEAAKAKASKGVAARAAAAGHLDRVTRDGWVSGWCWDPKHPARRLSLDVLVDGQVVGTTLASNWRGDLQQAGVGDGGHGFSYALPYEVMAQQGTLRIAVRESGGGGLLGDPVTLRIGRQAESEQRVAGLERQIRLLRGKLEALERQSAEQPAAEERAARALFATVAGFFRELAEGTPEQARGFGQGPGLRATLDDLAARLPALALEAPPADADTLVIVPASQPVEAVHRCLVALQAAGIDAAAELLVLDPGDADGSTALLPSLVRGLRYEHCGTATLPAAADAVLRRSTRRYVAFVDPRVTVVRGWLEAWRGCLQAEPDAAIVGATILRGDGLLQHAGFVLVDAGLRDPGQFAEAERSEHRHLRAVDAVAALAVGIDRARAIDAGGLDPHYGALTAALVALCARLPHAVLLQPAAMALWHGLDADPGQTLPELAGPDEDARRLRLALLQASAEGARAAAAPVGRALFVDDAVPRPDRDAGSVAAVEQMQVLRRLGWHVAFAPASGNPGSEAERRALERQGIEVVVPPQHPSVTQYLRDAGQGLDLVQIVRHRNAATLGPVVRELAPRAKLIFAPADLHFLRESREATVHGEAGDPTLRHAQRARELACVQQADATLLHSDHELQLLATEADPAKLHLLRWIVRPAAPGPGFAERDGMLFVGNFAHRPNLDAVLWYAQKIAPLLRRLGRRLVLHVVGAEPPPELASLAAPDIVLHGWVRDLDALLSRMRLSVAPLRYGAGFKGKVASSLAQGVPVVGTPIAFEGTGLQEGDGIATARLPAEFARTLAALHDDAGLWQTLSQRAFERVAALYSTEAADAAYRRLLATLDLPFRPAPPLGVTPPAA